MHILCIFFFTLFINNPNKMASHTMKGGRRHRSKHAKHSKSAKHAKKTRKAHRSRRH